MSATTPQIRDRQVDPEAAFEDLVLDHPDVCSGCFARIKRDHQKRGAGEHGYDTEATDDFGAVVVRGDDYYRENVVVGTEPAGTYGYRPLPRHRTVCGDCGSISGRAMDRTLSKVEMLTRVPQLVERLREVGVATNERAVRYAVRDLKSRDAIQALDMEIFARAVKLGIKHA